MADFPFTAYEFPMEYGEEGYKTAISRGYGGKERRDSIVSVSRRTFAIPLHRYSHADVNTMWTFMQARKGAFESFSLTAVKKEDGTSATFTVRFDADQFKYAWSSAILYDFGILKFIEDK